MKTWLHLPVGVFALFLGWLVMILSLWLGWPAQATPVARTGGQAFLPVAIAPYPRVLDDSFFTGCAMAHCTPSLSDDAHAVIPTAPVTRLWGPDPLGEGSSYGVGCTSNGRLAACAYLTGVTVYDGAGNIQWWVDLSPLTWFSAPIVTPYDTVVTASVGEVAHYDRFGRKLWANSHFSGNPISPVILQPNPTIIVATASGDLVAIDLWSGALLGGPFQMTHREGPLNLPCRTANTPGVRVGYGRFYIAADCTVGNRGQSFLMAYDFQPGQPDSFSLAWEFPYVGASGASPTIIADRIYFDGRTAAEPDIPHVFGLRDQDTFVEELWQRPMNGPVQTALAQDPRGGLWVFTTRWANDSFAPHPNVLRLDELSGTVLQTLPIDQLVADDPLNPPPVTPSSVMTIGQGPAGPALLISASVPLDDNTPVCEVAAGWIVAVDLNTSTALWKISLPVFNAITGTRHLFPTQYPVLRHPGDGRPIIVTAGACIGALAISSLPAPTQ